MIDNAFYANPSLPESRRAPRVTIEGFIITYLKLFTSLFLIRLFFHESYVMQSPGYCLASNMLAICLLGCPLVVTVGSCSVMAVLTPLLKK